MNTTKEVPDYSRPEEFVTTPLLAIVPIHGNVNDLEGFTSALYARYEKLSQVLNDQFSEQPSPEGGAVRNFEREMIKEVLAWLSIVPEEQS
jgi:hypothetical protein